MKNFNREAIQRMFDGRKGGGGGGTNNADLAGYATQMWVNQNYVSIEFFNRLFSIHGHDPEDESTPPTDISVLPNDMDSIVDSIESMVGFYTEEYLSALGQNGDQGGGGITLNAALASINNSPLGNPTGTNTVLMFNGTTWVYATMGSTDMNTVWTALADGTDTHQINVSHLTTALGSYFTQGSGISITNTVGGTGKTISLAQIQDLTAGTYKSVTVDQYGRVTAGTNPTTLAGYGITDALASNTTFWGRTIANGVVKGGIDQASYIEFADIASGTTNGGYIDFHYGGNTTANSGDYTSRIIEDDYDAVNSQGILKINNILWAKLSTGVSIGTSTISSDYKLNVAGYTKTTRLYLADGVYLAYDSTKSGVHLVGAGFYSDSYVSALGANSGGGGGGITLNEPLNGINNAGLGAPSTGGQAIVWNGSEWTYSINTTLRAGAIATTGGASIYGNVESTSGNFIASAGHGYTVSGKDNTYVLLAGGGTKALSDIVVGSVTNLSQTPLATDGSLSTFYSGDDLIYTAIPGTNSVADKPAGVGAFGILSFKTAGGYHGQILLDVGANLFVRSNDTLSGGWLKIATQTWVENRGYITGITSSMVTSALGYTPAASSDLSNYVTLATQQTISGGKRFSSIIDFDSWVVIWDGASHNRDFSIGWRTDYFNMYAYENVFYDICIGKTSADGGSLYFDASASSWGIGTATPAYALDVVGDVRANNFRGALVGNADTATSATTASKLSTVSKTLFGNTYWTSEGVPTSLGTSTSFASLDYISGLTMYGAFVLWESSNKAHDFNIFWRGDVVDIYAYENIFYDLCIGHPSNSTSDGALYYDASEKKWGIGTKTPSYTLSVNGDVSATNFRGNLVGNADTATTASKLSTVSKTLFGNTYWTSNGVPTSIGTSSTLANLNYVGDLTMYGAFTLWESGNKAHDFNIFWRGDVVDIYALEGSFFDLSIGYPSSSVSAGVLYLDASEGKWGIGKNNPSYSLDVAGDVRATNFRGNLVGNADTATKLATKRKIYGNDFDGTDDIKSSLTMEGWLVIWEGSSRTHDFDIGWRGNFVNMYAYENNTFYDICIGTTSATSSLYYKASNESVGICTDSPTQKLHVNGNAKIGSSNGNFIEIGAVRLVYDSSNNALKVVGNDGSSAANFYATGAVSAVGANTSGGGASNYIPLSGSTSITGDLTPSDNNYVNLGSSSKLWAGVYCTNLHAYGASSIAGNLTMAGNITPTVNNQYSLGTSSAQFGTAFVRCARIGHFCIETDTDGNYSSSRSNEINNYNGVIHLQYNSTNDVTLAGGGGNVAVGTTSVSASYKLSVSGSLYCSSFTMSGLSITSNGQRFDINTNNGAANLPVYVTGTWYGTFQNGSDIRLKSIHKNIDSVNVNDLSRAPIFDFTWIDGRDKDLHLGSSAQFWRDIFPNAISTMYDGHYAMDYGATALAAAVITARKVVDHEARIRLLEVENAALRNEINQLKKVA